MLPTSQQVILQPRRSHISPLGPIKNIEWDRLFDGNIQSLRNVYIDLFEWCATAYWNVDWDSVFWQLALRIIDGNAGLMSLRSPRKIIVDLL